MIIRMAHSAVRQYEHSPAAVRAACDKQLHFLLRNLRHPSLHAKKYEEHTGLWQGRINRNWRFYFFIRGDVYYVVSIRKHPK